MKKLERIMPEEMIRRIKNEPEEASGVRMIPKPSEKELQKHAKEFLRDNKKCDTNMPEEWHISEADKVLSEFFLEQWDRIFFPKK